MKYLYAFLLSFLFIMPVLAQETETSVTVNPDNINELIKTLESETARSEFLDNLKTLSQTSEPDQASDEAAVIALSDTLGFGSAIDGFLTQYKDLLKAANMSEGFGTQIGLTLLASLVALLAAFLVTKIINLIRKRSENWGQKVYLNKHRFRLYTRALRYVGKGCVLILYVFSLTSIWGIGEQALFYNDTVINLFSMLVNFIFVLFLGAFVWETVHGVLEHLMHKASAADSARLRTLLPIIRTVIMIVFGVMFTLILLSELGINILPLLAGAGVLGIAIGFGAQKFVQDFITGFTIILEDLFAIGDVVGVGGKTGLVEAITLRKVQLRAYDGTVFTVPFSEITTVDNLTKHYSYYLIDMGVAYREDTDEVSEYMRQVVDEMMTEEDFKDQILEPIEIAGVDQFADSAVIIKARIKTKPLSQWTVGREFNRRIKKVFDANDIEIPFPYQTMVLGMDKQGNSIGGPTSKDVRETSFIDIAATPKTAPKKKLSKAKSK